MSWQDLGIAAAVITAVIGAGYAIARVVRSFWDGFKLAVREATADIHEDVLNLRNESDQRHVENIERFNSIDARICTVEKDLKTHMKDAAQDRERNQGDGK